MATERSPSRTLASTAAAAVLETRLGWVCVVAQSGRVIATSLPAPTQAEAVSACPPTCGRENTHKTLAALLHDLRQYFRGEPIDLSQHPVDLSAQPSFTRRALLAACKIPYGQVRTYAWLARAAGRPGAARAAGQAMSRNPVPLLIPCHRVIGTGGKLTGFGGGLALKRALLELEGIVFPSHPEARPRIRPGGSKSPARRRSRTPAHPAVSVTRPQAVDKESA